LGVLEEISGVMEGKKEGKTSNGGLEGAKIRLRIRHIIFSFSARKLKNLT
jgi:hypothetical protein